MSATEQAKATAYCRECAWSGECPAIAKCPTCNSRQIRRIDGENGGGALHGDGEDERAPATLHRRHIGRWTWTATICRSGRIHCGSLSLILDEDNTGLEGLRCVDVLACERSTLAACQFAINERAKHLGVALAWTIKSDPHGAMMVEAEAVERR